MVDIKVRVVNTEGKDVARNGRELGEVIIKGDSISNDLMKENNKLYTDGWLRTGDQGTIDDNGQINIINPNKDLITNDGGKVSSFKIENVLSKHRAIREIVLITTPDITLGEALHAFVVLHDDCELTEQDLISFAQKHLSTHNCPKKITFLDELPRTTSGKILKTQLGNNL